MRDDQSRTDRASGQAELRGPVLGASSMNSSSDLHSLWAPSLSLTLLNQAGKGSG
jgi:hypothetical protein